MPLPPARLGIFLAAGNGSPGQLHALSIAHDALRNHQRVFLYLFDDAILLAGSAELNSLLSAGAIVYGCALAAQNRQIAMEDDRIIFCGLSMFSDILAGTDRLISFT